jgi:hypothetical protein
MRNEEGREDGKCSEYCMLHSAGVSGKKGNIINPRWRSN